MTLNTRQKNMLVILQSSLIRRTRVCSIAGYSARKLSRHRASAEQPPDQADVCRTTFGPTLSGLTKT
jgi:hypothetical protein